MHKDGVQGIAYRRPLSFCVKNYRQRFFDIRRLIHKNMTDTHPSRNDRDLAVFTAEAMQALAASRNDQIYKLMQF